MRVHALRKRRGLTQEQLAAALGTSRFQVIRWERDENEPEQYAQALADFFDEPVDAFRSPPAQSVGELIRLALDRLDEFERRLDALERA